MYVYSIHTFLKRRIKERHSLKGKNKVGQINANSVIYRPPVVPERESCLETARE